MNSEEGALYLNILADMVENKDMRIAWTTDEHGIITVAIATTDKPGAEERRKMAEYVFVGLKQYKGEP